MYQIISANRSPKRAPKNWRIFEKGSLEKYFGKVVDVNGEDGFSVLEAFNKYHDTIRFIRWYPDPELLTTNEYLGILRQSCEIGNIPYIVNSPHGFLNVQSKEEAFKIWKKNNINCPKHFTFSSKNDFYEKLDTTEFDYPFLIRLNNDVGGRGSYLIKGKKEIRKGLRNLIKNYNKHTRLGKGIETKMICVQYIDTIDRDKGINISYRIHVSGDKIVSGYARISSSDDWIAITGKFTREKADSWLEYNMLCEKICRENEMEICRAVKILNLNYQGVDLIIENDTNKFYFLEVQPTYASGYPMQGYCGYHPPFYNPSYPELVKFLIDERDYLIKRIPVYYNNWLDKKNHFDLAYKYLAEYLNVRT